MSASPEPAVPQATADVLLTDGSVATIRPARPDDRQALYDLHDGVSDESLRWRFFAYNPHAGHPYVDMLLARPAGVISLVAVVHGRIGGLATAEASGSTAEVSLLVADALHGHGLGTLLLEHLAAACRLRGIRHFTAEVLSDNHPMLRVLLDAGFAARRSPAGGIVSWDVSTAASEEAVRAADRRERVAEARSLAPLLHPRSVAVVGVRSKGGGIGRTVLDAIVSGGFTGRVYVVHPTASIIGGVPAYPDLSAVPEHVDVAIVAVPAPSVLAVMDDAARAGVSATVVISSGFSELGPAGAEIQSQLLVRARRHDIRLVGPNCLGLLCNDEQTRLNATFTSAVPPAGGVAIASQSGGVGIEILDVARDLGLGVQTFVSLGNKADVSGNDLLAAWQDDPGVTAAALYLESFGNAVKFARIARHFSERKPLLAVVGGRSAGGARGGASHTAAAATPMVGLQALFAQAGVIACTTAEQLARAALVLTEQPLPRGRRIAIVSNAGGVGILAADAAEDRGLTVPELSTALRTRLREHVAGTAGVSNPVDLGAGAGADQLGPVLEALLDSGEVDALVVAVVATSAVDPAPLADVVVQTRARRPGLPLLLVTMGGFRVPPGDAAGVTVLTTPSEAVDALAAAVSYAEWRAVPAEVPDVIDEDRAATARSLARSVLGSAAEVWVTHVDQHDLLAPYGLGPVGVVASNPLEAGAAAASSGFPVAMKVADPSVVHKSDRGLVRVGLESVTEVLSAVREFEQELGHGNVPVLLQPVVSGVELALGVVRDPTFGPLVMVAAGGVATGLWNDRTFLMPPLVPGDAERALRSLRIWPLLDGYRGAPQLDVAAVSAAILSLGRLAVEVPEVRELDLNPLVVTRHGVQLVDVKLGLAKASASEYDAPRQLGALQ